MSTLEDIKARAEKATEGPWDAVGAANIVPPHGPNIGRITRQADQSFVAHARTDVPKLVAALEAVEALLSERATGFRETADRLTQQVIDRDPGMDAETANRYAIHAQSAESALRMIQRTIDEALS